MRRRPERQHHQSATAKGGGSVSQDASISQSATALGEDGGNHGADAANDFFHLA